MENIGDVFNIERSRDGKRFEYLGSMDAKGIANSHYTFVDAMPFTGINYYRLHLLNNDGTTGYSKIVNAFVHDAFEVEAYPNPVNDKLTVMVRGNISGEGIVTLCDASGRELEKSKIVSGKIVTFSMNHLAQGVYWIKYNDSSNTRTIKIVKK